ncbi:PREDICTED: uncharacterized protein LOC104592495 [Nelumbo nucifera]|nr:PREDICTED: uncharacterized protein LOC104592495 [Nelumbo nucifera]
MAAAARVLVIMSSTSSSISGQTARKNSNCKRVSPAKNIVPTRFWFSAETKTRNFQLRASSSQPQQPEQDDSAKNNNNGNDVLLPSEDLSYLWKLGAGSLGSAAVIKYGSILFPEITRPSLLQALIMITTPVIIAIFLLVRQSQGQSKEPFL